MNSRAITLIATIAVIGIVAVGAGYAYTALTLNEGNNASAHYITLTQTPAYTFNASFDEAFDSATAGTAPTGPAYKISGNTPYTATYDQASYTLFKFGTVTLTATPTGYDDNASLPTATLTIDNSIQATDGFASGTLMNYYLANSSNALVAKYVTGTGWVGMDGNAYSLELTKNNGQVVGYGTVALSLCYGYLSTSAADFHGLGNYVSEVPATGLTNGKIIFKVTTS